MTDILVPMPPDFRYLNQFSPSQWSPNPSKYRCATACVAMATEFARPGSHIPEHFEDYLYAKYDGPDVATDTQGTTFENLEKMLSVDARVGYVNMAALIDLAAQGNLAPLHSELMAQNQQRVPQILTVADESQLYDASSPPKKLHAWADQGLSHVIFRVGYSDSEGYGYYYEPAAPAFGQPVRIPWANIVKAGILHAVGIMGPGVEPPPGYGPSGFLYQQGTWPTPKPPTKTIDASEAEQIVAILRASTEAQANSVAKIAELLGVK